MLSEISEKKISSVNASCIFARKKKSLWRLIEIFIDLNRWMIEKITFKGICSANIEQEFLMRQH